MAELTKVERGFLEMSAIAMDAVDAARQAVDIAEELVRRNRELDPPEDGDFRTLKVDIRVPVEMLMPGVTVNADVFIDPVREAIQTQIAAKQAEFSQ